MDFEADVSSSCVPVRKRTRARELALQMLYVLDQRGADFADQIDGLIDRGDPDVQVRIFARGVVKGAIENRERIDKQITDVAENWDLHRMAVVDRNVLRLACYEILFLDDIPPKVSINEAIELAKKFSTIESGSFVNGILDKINQQLGR